MTETAEKELTINGQQAETAVEDDPRYLSHTKITSVKHDFTDIEMRSIADRLVECHHTLDLILDEEAESKTDFKKRKAEQEKKIKELWGRHRTGYEYRDIESRVRLDDETKERVYEEVDTGREVKREPFHAGDYQTNLDLGENEDRELRAAYEQGVEAFDNDLNDNPFDDLDEPAQHKSWQNGWEDREKELTSEPAEEESPDEDEEE